MTAAPPPSSDQMRFASAMSERLDPGEAVAELLAQVTSRISGASIDLAFVFMSSLYQTPWPPLLRRIREALSRPLLLGCTGGGVLGATREVEFAPAMVLSAAHLPRVGVHPFTVLPEDLEEPRDPGFWIEKCGANPSQHPVGVLLPEPYSCDAQALIATLNAVYPAMPVIGGMASSATQRGGDRVFFNDEAIERGAVGVLLTGDVALQTIVSQGCRPIGRPYIITKGEENVIFELAGVPALEALQELLMSLPAKDRALAQDALFLGVVMNEQKPAFRRGDFLVRNLVGLDPESGALAIGERIDVGQTVQFQVRDAETSREDLRHLLREQTARLAGSPSAGALLFSCLGRGKDLYGEPHYDIRTIQAAIGACPIAGFFCNGEIGPVGGRNFVHGFTSSLGLFRPRDPSDEPR